MNRYKLLRESFYRFVMSALMLMTLVSCNDFKFSSKTLKFENDNPTTTTPPTSVVDSFLTTLDGGYCLNKSQTDIFCWGSSLFIQPENVAPLLRTQLIHLDGKLISDVITSHYDTCAIDTAGVPYCWGSNNGLKIPTPIEMTGVLSGKTAKSISLGDYHGCMIASDDLVYCWGSNNKGQLGNGNLTSSSTPVAVSASGVLSGKTIKKIYSYSATTCAIASDDKVYCWGEGSFGALGNNTNANSNIPVAAAGGDLGAKTSKAFFHYNLLSCVIASDDKAYCWGRSQYAAFGVNSLFTSPVPKAIDFTGVLSGKTAKSLALGLNYGCVLASDDKVYCWGTNSRLVLGDGTNSSFSDVPTSVSLGARTVKKLVIADTTACAIADNDNVYCWGDGYNGQRGDGTQDDSNVPLPVLTTGVLSGKTVKNLYASNNRFCAIASDNLSYCWGHGQVLGNNDSINYSALSPVAVIATGALSGKTITKLSLADSHTCAIANDQKIYCWGEQSDGQLGVGNTSTINYPIATQSGVSDELIQDSTYVKVFGEANACVQRSNGELYCGVLGSGLTLVSDFGSLNVTHIEYGGTAHKCAIMDDNSLYCWGEGLSGQLGDGLSTDSAIPVKIDMSGVLSGKTIKSVGLGQDATCVIASDDLLYCWGKGNSGLLGNGSNSNQASPVAVSTSGVLSGKKIKSLYMNWTSICVVADDDKAYCWGDGSDGQLGNGTNATSNIPVAVSMAGALSGKKIKSLKNAGMNVCAIADDNLAYCWGNGQSGQLGNGASINSNIPVAVDMTGILNGKTIKQLGANGGATCVIASDDLPYCFGYGQEGMLGNSSSTDSNIPVAVTVSGALSGKKIVGINLSYNSACVLDTNEDVFCWGNGSYSGEIGDGQNTVTPAPVKLTF